MRGSRRWAPVLAVLVAALATAGVVLPARAAVAATVPALAASLPRGAMLTLPAGDRFRDTVPVTITGRSAWSVDVLAVGRTASVVLASGVRLVHTATGYSATVRVSDRHLHRGTWTVRVRRSGHPGSTADASRHLRVGSGTARTVSVAPSAGTYFPFKDGHLDTVKATVTVRDETGAAVPVQGSLQLAAGSRIRGATVAGSAGPATVRISAVGLPLGSAALVARVAGPAGAPTTARRGLTLAATRLTGATLRPSALTVEPVVDGMADSVSVKVGMASSTGVVIPVSGTLSVARDGAGTVATWPLDTSKARTIAWNGRVNGTIVPGIYRFTVSARGPEGATTVAKSDPVEVSADHLPFRIQDRFAVGAGNQQGLAVSNGRTFVTTDLTGGMARIDEYDRWGAPVGSAGPLSLGHAAELAVRESTGDLYVANGGPATPTKVFVVDPAAGTIRDTYDLDALGPNGMVAFDQQADRMLVFAGTEGDYTVTPVELDHTVGASLPVTVSGIPQGIDLVHGEIWIYTSLAGPGAGNRITRIDRATGATIDTIELAMAGEGEGLAYDPATDTVFVGAHSGNRVGVLQPVADE